VDKLIPELEEDDARAQKEMYALCGYTDPSAPVEDSGGGTSSSAAGAGSAGGGGDGDGGGGGGSGGDGGGGGGGSAAGGSSGTAGGRPGGSARGGGAVGASRGGRKPGGLPASSAAAKRDGGAQAGSAGKRPRDASADATQNRGAASASAASASTVAPPGSEPPGEISFKLEPLDNPGLPPECRFEVMGKPYLRAAGVLKIAHLRSYLSRRLSVRQLHPSISALCVRAGGALTTPRVSALAPPLSHRSVFAQPTALPHEIALSIAGFSLEGEVTIEFVRDTILPRLAIAAQQQVSFDVDGIVLNYHRVPCSFSLPPYPGVHG
jgi:hypothetical protein